MSSTSVRILVGMLSVLTAHAILGQVKIGENPETIDEASLLELESTSKVLVLSRVSNAEMNAITPLNGGVVYNTDEKCIFYYNDNSWNNLCDVTNGTDGNDGDGGGGDGGNDGDAGGISITEQGEIIYTYITEEGEETVITIGESGILHVGSPGSIFFASEDGTPTGDNENFFWNNEDNKLGIGTSDPENELDVNGIIKSSRAHIGQGSESYPGYHFQGNVDTGMYSPVEVLGGVGFSTSGTELMRLTPDQRVGINVKDPQATLHVGGDLRVDGTIINTSGKTVANKVTNNTPIRRLALPRAVLTLNDHTLILEGQVEHVILPAADTTNTGHILILKDLGGKRTELNRPYKNLNNEPVKATKRKGTIWIQSDGTEWQQIN